MGFGKVRSNRDLSSFGRQLQIVIRQTEHTGKTKNSRKFHSASRYYFLFFIFLLKLLMDLLAARTTGRG